MLGQILVKWRWKSMAKNDETLGSKSAWLSQSRTMETGGEARRANRTLATSQEVASSFRWSGSRGWKPTSSDARPRRPTVARGQTLVKLRWSTGASDGETCGSDL